MATATSGTLTAGVASAGVPVDRYPTGVNVVNRSGDYIWVTKNGTAPTAGGNNCHPVLPGGVRNFSLHDLHSGGVRLFSASAAPYTVESAE